MGGELRQPYYTRGITLTMQWMDPVSRKAESSFYCQGNTSFRLSNKCSSLQVGLVAVYQALQHTRKFEHQHKVMHTDSKSLLQVLKHTKLQVLLQDGRQVILSFIPKHTGISGNEWADESTKALLQIRELEVQVTPSLSQTKTCI